MVLLLNRNNMRKKSGVKYNSDFPNPITSTNKNSEERK